MQYRKHFFSCNVSVLVACRWSHMYLYFAHSVYPITSQGFLGFWLLARWNRFMWVWCKFENPSCVAAGKANLDALCISPGGSLGKNKGKNLWITIPKSGSMDPLNCEAPDNRNSSDSNSKCLYWYVSNFIEKLTYEPKTVMLAVHVKWIGLVGDFSVKLSAYNVWCSTFLFLINFW